MPAVAFGRGEFPMKRTRVALLDGGETSAKEYQIYWNYPSEAVVSMPTYGVLIDHADGLFLFDTGFDLVHVQTKMGISGALQTPGQTIPKQLELLGLGDSSGEPELEIYTPHFETLRGDQQIATGLHLFETPGHTPGHYSLLVELSGRRPMLFSGDACYSRKGLDLMKMPASHVDPVKGY